MCGDTHLTKRLQKEQIECPSDFLGTSNYKRTWFSRFLTAEFLNPAEGIAEPGDGNSMTLFSTHTVASPTFTSFSSCSDAETGHLLQQCPLLFPPRLCSTCKGDTPSLSRGTRQQILMMYCMVTHLT